MGGYDFQAHLCHALLNKASAQAGIEKRHRISYPYHSLCSKLKQILYGYSYTVYYWVSIVDKLTDIKYLSTQYSDNIIIVQLSFDFFLLWLSSVFFPSHLMQEQRQTSCYISSALFILLFFFVKFFSFFVLSSSSFVSLCLLLSLKFLSPLSFLPFLYLWQLHTILFPQ